MKGRNKAMKERSVTYYSMGEKIVGTVYLPDDYKEGEKLPCVIPCSGYTGINAVYPALFSRLLTAHGYACVGFDYRGWKPSEGRVGYTTCESEYEDIVSTYVFATQQPEIQADNISLFGWGMSAPIVLKVAADIPEIKAVGTGNGYYDGDRWMQRMWTYPEYVDMLEVFRKDRITRVLTGEGALAEPYAIIPDDNGGSPVYLTKTLSDLTTTMDDTLYANWGGRKNFPPKHSYCLSDSIRRIHASDYVGRIAPRGVFIGHSKADVTHPVTEAYDIFAAAGEGRVLCLVEGNHNGWMFDNHPEFKKFGAALVAFYDKYMK